MLTNSLRHATSRINSGPERRIMQREMRINKGRLALDFQSLGSRLHQQIAL